MDKINLKYLVSIFLCIVVFLGLGFVLLRNQETQKESNTSSSYLDSMVGKPLPNVQLTDADGKVYTTDSFKSKNTVLFFSEGIMCYPACWDEIAALAADPRLNNDDTAVYSVVADSPKQWVTAREQMPSLAKAMLLFDQNTAVVKQLGISNLPSSMHAGSTPGHTYIVLDKQGVVRYVFDDPRMANNVEQIVSEIIKFSN